MNKLWKKIVFSVLSFALIGLIVIRIFFVNTAAIQQQIEYYEKDEEVKLDGCFINIVDENTTGYSITVHSGKLTTFGEFAKKYKGNTEPSAYELTSESKIIELDVSIKNEGNSDGYIFFEQTAGSFNFTLKPNSVKRLSIPFETNNDYELMHNDYPIEESYDLVVSRAPVKKIIRIDL